MRATSSPGSVGNEFNDYDPSTNPNASIIEAAWANDVQGDLIAIQDEAGLAQADYTEAHVLKAIQKIAKELSKYVGELFFLDEVKDANAYDSGADIEEYFPAICLSSIAGSQVLDVSVWPLLVPHLRAKLLKYQAGKGTEVDNWSVTVSGSDITFPNIAAANAMLAALAEDQLFHGSYSNWRTVNIDGTDYAISGINLGTRVVTVTGSPTTGSQTARFYAHRIAGSTTTAREFACNGMTLVGPNDSDDELIPGLRVRNRLQGFILDVRGKTSGNPITHPAGGAVGGSNNTPASAPASSGDEMQANSFLTDGTNGTPRTGPTTRPDQLTAHLYRWGKKVL